MRDALNIGMVSVEEREEPKHPNSLRVGVFYPQTRPKEIAADLELGVKTVESHRINLRRKRDIHETATLVRYAIRQGLTTP
jgi:hypothetical protein